MRTLTTAAVVMLAGCGAEKLSGFANGEGSSLGDGTTVIATDGPGGGNQGGGDPVDPSVIETACKTGTRQSLKVSFSFPDNTRECPWGQADNNSMRDAYLTARLSQTQHFDLPDSAKLCGLEFTFEEQKFRYDDHFFITLDGVVLATHFDMSESLERDGIWEYRWSDVKDTRFIGSNGQNLYDGAYCPGMSTQESSCYFPPHDTAGKILLDLGEPIVQRIMALDGSRTSHDMSFITTGDNNPETDCTHVPISFGMVAHYVVP